MIHLSRSDIVDFQGDAIVNAANPTLLGGGGVDGAIHRAAGRELYEECKLLGGCQPGDAKVSKGYRLKARYVIHTVGPVWKGGGHDEAEILASAYRRCLELALEMNLSSIAFPNISTGVYGFPKPLAAQIAVATVKEILESHPELEVHFICFDIENYREYERLL
ncbi:MAG: O-acetyl-ADP-ribose deacetylase [Candidatus Cloacimonadaceae bacterium]|jgi:O-acetyl-ADP-ribose deacetylase (regulator of RNase III)|nr:O-acetyl-ADP-ribose deacetylase [Candidatus Cloacimonadota bacterium]MCK9243420.1 O-acetyl-ADP-ribose deacetylase [Candidatus Cloacimonadota bacterium]MDD3102913.1 O-acetyl-ADP-ribose deacetylase [Candidatus Cloacimonadota bacterium]MDD3532612.1 O-acetyl-ADP-ribose deacetylase [Candidatus Cloacimonadota bacterium]MDY0127978.1 O-acetyl-ADP-ribose deacetylase [Candidatus Cloacimonadaceae bacterium]